MTLTLENINEAKRDELRAFAKTEKLPNYTTLKVDGLRELVRVELERREQAAWKQRMFAMNYGGPIPNTISEAPGTGESEQATRQSWTQVKRRQRRRSGRKAGRR